MKKIFPILFLFCSCSSQPDKTTVAIKDSTVEKLTDRHFRIDPKQVFEQYALQSDLVSTANNPNIAFPQLNDTLKFAVDSLYKVDTTDLKTWTALLLLKTYAHQLDCCHQSYEARVDEEPGMAEKKPLDKEHNYVLYTFLALTHQLDLAASDVEFFSSGFIYGYLLEHPESANNKLIRPLFEKVKKIINQMENRYLLSETKDKKKTSPVH